MKKSHLVVGFIVVLCVSVGVGFWASAPATDQRRIDALERKLHETEAALAAMSRKSASNSPAPITSASSSSHESALQIANASSRTGENVVVESEQQAKADSARAGQEEPDGEGPYEKMVATLGLSPNQRQQLDAINKERSKAREDAFAKLRDPSLSKAQRQAILSEIKGTIAQMDDSLRQLLGSDSSFDAYNGWQAEGHERSELRSARAIFQNAGDPLSPEQESWLADTLYGLRRNTQGLGDPYSLDMLGGRSVGGSYVTQSLNKFDGDTRLLLDSSRSQFSPVQLRALNAVRASQRAALEAQILILARTTAGKPGG